MKRQQKIQSHGSLRNEVKAVARGERRAPKDAAAPSFGVVPSRIGWGQSFKPVNEPPGRLPAPLRDQFRIGAVGSAFGGAQSAKRTLGTVTVVRK